MVKVWNTDDTKCWLRCGQQEVLYIADGNANWHNPMEENLVISMETAYVFIS